MPLWRRKHCRQKFRSRSSRAVVRPLTRVALLAAQRKCRRRTRRPRLYRSHLCAAWVERSVVLFQTKLTKAIYLNISTTYLSPECKATESWHLAYMRIPGTSDRTQLWKATAQISKIPDIIKWCKLKPPISNPITLSPHLIDNDFMMFGWRMMRYLVCD